MKKILDNTQKNKKIDFLKKSLEGISGISDGGISKEIPEELLLEKSQKELLEEILNDIKKTQTNP